MPITPRDFKTDITVNGVAVSLAGHTHAASSGVNATIGDGTSTSFLIVHNLNTRDVTVECYTNSGSYETLQPLVTRPSVNEVGLYFLTAPTTNSVRILIRV